jgi:hypothetical protein
MSVSIRLRESKLIVTYPRNNFGTEQHTQNSTQKHFRYSGILLKVQLLFPNIQCYYLWKSVLFFNFFKGKSKVKCNWACMGHRRGTYRVLVGKKPLRRPRRKWKYNIKLDFQEVCWDGMNRSSWLRTGTSVGRFECGNEPRGCIKCGVFLNQLSNG